MTEFDNEVRPRKEDFLDPAMANESERLQARNRTRGLGAVLGIAAVTVIGILVFGKVFAGVAAGLFVWVIAALVYLIPSMVAAWRRHHNALAIVALNLLLGWTFIGWAVALVWALTEKR
jgi:hypothetical protein